MKYFDLVVEKIARCIKINNDEIVFYLKTDACLGDHNDEILSRLGGNCETFLYLLLNDVKVEQSTFSGFDNNIVFYIDKNNILNELPQIRKQLDSFVKNTYKYNCTEEDLINNDYLSSLHQTDDIKQLIKVNNITRDILNVILENNGNRLDNDEKKSISNMLETLKQYPLYLTQFSYRKIITVDRTIKYNIDDL